MNKVEPTPAWRGVPGLSLELGSRGNRSSKGFVGLKLLDGP